MRQLCDVVEVPQVSVKKQRLLSNDWVDVEAEIEKDQTVVFGNILSEKDFELDKSYITSFEPVKWSEIFEKYEAGFDIRAEKYSHTFGLF